MYALIIAGGAGERLRPLTDDRPKPMIPVGDKPILQRQIEWLRGEGVTNFVLLCGYRANVIQEHFGDGSRFDVSIDYSFEDEPLGRGGALRKGFALVPDSEDTVIATNGAGMTTTVQSAGLPLGSTGSGGGLINCSATSAIGGAAPLAIVLFLILLAAIRRRRPCMQ